MSDQISSEGAPFNLGVTPQTPPLTFNKEDWILKADVLKALGEEVEVASIKDLEERVYVIPAQNQLRSQIKKELNL